MTIHPKAKTGEVLALVPARGGSKSMPRKNLRVIAGKRMVVHSIDHALAARTINRVILTTDDQEIAEVGRAAGAEVPFIRPAEIAQDLSTDYEFVRHALEWLRANEGYDPDLVVQLRPTTPLRDLRHIDRAVEALGEQRRAGGDGHEGRTHRVRRAGEDLGGEGEVERRVEHDLLCRDRHGVSGG